MKRVASKIGWGVVHCLVVALTFTITVATWMLLFLPGIAITFGALLVALHVPVPRAKSLAIAAILGCLLCIPYMIAIR